jgi:hypothetical protein
MTNKEIFKKILEKAIDNGWGAFGGHHVGQLMEDYVDDWGNIDNLNSIIFEHDFAKAFWKNEIWELNLTRLVLEKDRLQYLKQFLDEQ